MRPPGFTRREALDDPPVLRPPGSTARGLRSPQLHAAGAVGRRVRRIWRRLVVATRSGKSRLSNGQIGFAGFEPIQLAGENLGTWDEVVILNFDRTADYQELFEGLSLKMASLGVTSRRSHPRRLSFRSSRIGVSAASAMTSRSIPGQRINRRRGGGYRVHRTVAESVRWRLRRRDRHAQSPLTRGIPAGSTLRVPLATG